MTHLCHLHQRCNQYSPIIHTLTVTAHRNTACNHCQSIYRKKILSHHYSPDFKIYKNNKSNLLSLKNTIIAYSYLHWK